MWAAVTSDPGLLIWLPTAVVLAGWYGVLLVRLGISLCFDAPRAVRRPLTAGVHGRHSRTLPSRTWPVRRVRGVTYAGAMAGAPVVGLPDSGIA